MQREFLNWLAEVNDRLPCRVTSISRDDADLVVWLDVAHPHMFVHLSRIGISVGVEWKGERWDDLYDDIAHPEKITGGYVCSYCEPDNREVYGSRADLWRDHLYEPWLAWLTKKLGETDVLVLYQIPGATWAKLGSAALVEEQDHVVATVPLRRHIGAVRTSIVMPIAHEADVSIAGQRS